MPSQPTILKMPAYLPGFRCTGPQCVDHCCYGWDIVVDKRSYRRYRKLGSTELGKSLRKALRRNRNDPSSARYATFFRAGDTCPFLTTDRLCRIHAELGEEYLPETCVLFPRRIRARREWVDLSASLACPEIAARALEDPEGVEMVETEMDPESAGVLRSVEPILPPEIEAFGLGLRPFALSLVKDRRYALWQRILSLGLLLEMVGLRKRGGGEGALDSLLDGFAHRMDSGEVMALIENAPTLTGLQLQLVKRLHDEMISGNRVKALKECTDECFAGLDYAGNQPFTDDIGERYDSAHDQYYRPFFERCGFLLENYLANYLLHHDLCFHRGRHLYDDFVMMALSFSMLKTYLTGMAAWHRGDMNPAAVTKLIYAFTKVVEPDFRFRDYALGLLAESGCTDMMHLSVLIKN
jgi:lysine-N-methylase